MSGLAECLAVSVSCCHCERSYLEWSRSPASGLYGAFLVKGVTPFLVPFFCSTRAAEHSSAPTAYFHRRRAQRRSRTALLQRRRRLVLDGREHGGRLPTSGGWPREDPRGACHWPRSNANHACIRLNPRS